MVAKYFYAIFIALLITLFVAAAVDLVYPEPKQPSYTSPLDDTSSRDYNDSYDQTTPSSYRDDYQEKEKKYEKERKSHDRTKAGILLTIGLLVLAGGVAWNYFQVNVLSSSVVLGGVLTILQTSYTAYSAESKGFELIILTIALSISAAAGWFLFDRRKPTEFTPPSNVTPPSAADQQPAAPPWPQG